MKSEIQKNKANTQEEEGFPLLMKSLYSDLVILFLSKTKGVVIHSDEDYPLGDYAEDWAEFDDVSEWQRFEGKVELSND